jgi:ribosomal protein S18 acetylase RimI-like enzyme
MLRIRRFREEDVEAVLKLHEEALRVVGAYWPGPWDDDLRNIATTYLDQSGEFLVGELGGDVIAMGAVRRLDDVTAEIKRMRVSPQEQRRGHGTVMLVALEQRARELGYKRLSLDTGEQQTAARRFYERHAYREVGRRELQGFEQRLFEKWL